MKGYLSIPLVVALVILSAPVPADTGFKTLPFTPAPSDGCVGTPETPICAILTYRACIKWSRPDLCQAVGHAPTYMAEGVDIGIGRFSVFEARVIDQKPLTANDIPSWTGNVGAWVKKEHPSPKWRPGDLAVLTEWWGRSPDSGCLTRTRDDPRKEMGEGCPLVERDRYDVDFTHVLRKDGNKWRVLYVHFDPTDHGDFWRAFWNRK